MSRLPRPRLAVLAATLTLAIGLLLPVLPARAQAPTGVCSGVSGCRVVLHRDVDGDGRGDSVGVVARHPERDGSVTVRVLTATGRLLTLTNRHVSWYADVWYGATALDGRPGAELVVGQLAGANFMQFRVITVRHGHLKLLKSPKRYPADTSTYSRYNWPIDGSYSFNTGIYRSVTKGRVTLTMKSAVRDFSDPRNHPRHQVMISTYRWHDDHWAKRGFERVTRPEATAFRIGGWHVAGLDRFPS